VLCGFTAGCLNVISKGTVPYSILHTGKTSIYEQCDYTDKQMEELERVCRKKYGRVETERRGLKLVITVWRD